MAVQNRIGTKQRHSNMALALVLGTVLTGAYASAAAAQDSTPAPDPVTLSFWGWVPNLEDAVATWNEENPDIQVEFHRMTGDDGAKIPAAIDAGSAPDIIQMGSADIPKYVVADRLTDIRPYLDDVQSAYDAAAWSAVSFDPATYAVPQDAGPSGMLYRADLFSQYDIPVPATWDEYLDAGRALKAADPDLYLAQFSPNEAGFWLQDVWQAGGSYTGIDGDSWTVEVNGPESLMVADYWQQALDEGLFKVVQMWSPDYWADINDGHIATINYLAWFPSLLKENAPSLAGDWMVAPSPRFGSSDTAGSGGYGVNAVPKGTEHVDEAVQFIKWLNTSPEGLDFLVTSGGLFPAAKAGLDLSALSAPDEYFDGQAINDVFRVEATKVPASWTAGPTLTLVNQHLSDEFAMVATGEQSFATALDNVAAKQKADLEALGLSVK